MSAMPTAAMTPNLPEATRVAAKPVVRVEIEKNKRQLGIMGSAERAIVEERAKEACKLHV